ncbi:MAG: methyl-accepting chemotaxis protein [Pseudomonadota bacterium]
MPLIKTDELNRNARSAHNGTGSPVPAPTFSPKGHAIRSMRNRPRTHARTQKAAERIAAATTQLASGMTQASAAAEQLRRSMEQIATGSGQASRAAEGSARALNAINRRTNDSKVRSREVSGTIDSLQLMTSQVSEQIMQSVGAIAMASEREAASVVQVAELERQAGDIGEIVNAVARIADQTNLLALNAAIEAARAGEHGKGFAVVADEVRTLAETSETSARDIQDLIGEIQKDVKIIADGINRSSQAAKAEVERGRKVTTQLEAMRTEMFEIKEGADEIRDSAEEAVVAANEALRGAETIAAAAEQQSAACDETMKMVEQQSAALSESEQAALELQDIADILRDSTDIAKSAEDVAASAEELSATVEEINRAADQVTTSVQEISRASQTSAAATEQAATAIGQMERGAQTSRVRSEAARDKSAAMQSALSENRVSVQALIDGMDKSLHENAQNRERINVLEQLARRIDKTVDAITTVSVQTNMLAVNGSIEAARAGEFGKGFMVVSTDIRNLAHDSSENAERIKDLVKSIQDQIVHVRRDLKEISNLAFAEVEKNRAISQRLEMVETQMGTVVDGAKSLLMGADEMVVALGQAKSGTQDIAAAAHQADHATSECASAMREQAKGIHDLASSVDELASLADELQSAA